MQFVPHNGYKISFTIGFDHPVFNDKPQTVSFDFSDTSYVKEVCRARGTDRGSGREGSDDESAVRGRHRPGYGGVQCRLRRLCHAEGHRRGEGRPLRRHAGGAEGLYEDPV